MENEKEQIKNEIRRLVNSYISITTDKDTDNLVEFIAEEDFENLEKSLVNYVIKKIITERVDQVKKDQEIVYDVIDNVK